MLKAMCGRVFSCLVSCGCVFGLACRGWCHLCGWMFVSLLLTVHASPVYSQSGDAPADLDASADGGDYVLLTWTAPAEDAGAVTGYRIRYASWTSALLRVSAGSVPTSGVGTRRRQPYRAACVPCDDEPVELPRKGLYLECAQVRVDAGVDVCGLTNGYVWRQRSCEPACDPQRGCGHAEVGSAVGGRVVGNESSIDLGRQERRSGNGAVQVADSAWAAEALAGQ